MQATQQGRRRRRYRLLYRLEAGLELPMFFLAIAWLWLFLLEMFRGLTPVQDVAVLSIWALFIVEFSLKLLLSVRRWRYLRRNWLAAVALLVPALRVFRLLRAFQILRAGRVVNTTRFVRALTSGKRFFSELREAQGPPPEPEMNVGVVVAGGGLVDIAAMQAFAQRVTDAVRPELEQASGLPWIFHRTEPAVLSSDEGRQPADFLDDASLRMAEGPFDLVIVVTDVPLMSRKRRIEPGLASTTSRIVVLSTRSLTAASRGHTVRALDSPEVHWNGAALLLHLLGHIAGLRHTVGGVMAPFQFRERRRSLPSFDARQRRVLRGRAARMPEREMRGGNALEALVFHLLMAGRHPGDVLRPLLYNRAVLLPLSLPGLATAAVAPTFLLIFNAEIWDVGLSMANGTAALYATISVLAASFYLVRVQNLFLPRKEKRTLTEHLAVANSVIFLSVLLACVGLFLMVGGLALLIEIYIFPEGLMQTWPTLDRPEVTLADMLRLAAFVSTIGVTTGALAGGFESRTVIRHLALFHDEA